MQLTLSNLPYVIIEKPLILTHLISISIGLIVIYLMKSILDLSLIILWFGFVLLGLNNAIHDKKEFLNPILRFIFSLVLIFFVIFIHIDKHWQIVLSYVLIVLLGIKAIELNKLRDVFQVVALSLLGLGVASFLRFDLIFGIMMAIQLFLSILLMLWQHLMDSIESIEDRYKVTKIFTKSAIYLSFVIFIVILPLSFVFFFILPRNLNPIFRGESGLTKAKVGFSSKIRPGAFNEIIESDEVAFRVKFESEVGGKHEFYWVGAILWDTNGIEWSTNPPEPPEFHQIHKNYDRQNAIIQTITLPARDEPYLFALYYPYSIKGINGLQFFKDGTIKSSFPLSMPTKYTVISSSPPTKITLTPREQNLSLSLPKDLDPRIIKLANEIRGSLSDPFEISKRIENYLKSPPFKYSTKSPPGYEQGQSLSDFLFTTKTGYCELYASAMAILLRANNIPSRLVAGYKGAEYNPVGDYWVVKEKFAHAWVQAYIPDKGWINFDPTPSLNIVEATTNLPQNLRVNARTLSREKRIYDWLQWQWINLIIDLTPEKQRQIWREISSRLSSLQKSKGEPVSSRDIKFDFDKEILKTVFFIFITGIFILAITKLIRVRIPFMRFLKEDNHRLRAIKILMKYTPVKVREMRPGFEEIYFKWWKENFPERCDRIKEIYYYLRYGPNPTKDQEKEFISLLRDKTKS